MAVFSLFGANGATMVEHSLSGLSLGDVVSYGDMANPRTEYVVVEDIASSDYGFAVINTERLSRSTVTVTSIEGLGGWEWSGAVKWTPEAVADLVSRSDAHLNDESAKRAAVEVERAARKVRGAARLAAEKPEWATGVIVARLEKNESDSMTDYFATSTSRTVFLGWSKSKRNSFAELRKAAAKFAPTAEFGPKLGRFSPFIRFTKDGGVKGYWGGERSHWHSELLADSKTFTTRVEAEAFIAESGTPYEIGFDGEVGKFEWAIHEESIEHRENYSGGRGYVLGSRDYTSGWTVLKINGFSEDLFGGSEENLVGLH
jgi:hypothetical protein